MDDLTPVQHGQLFTEKLSELEQQQKMLTHRMEKLNRHIQAVKTLEDLQNDPYQESDIDTDCIVSFDLIEQDKLRQYIENPYLYRESSTLRHYHWSNAALPFHPIWLYPFQKPVFFGERKQIDISLF